MADDEPTRVTLETSIYPMDRKAEGW